MTQKLRGFAKDSFLYGLGDGLGRIASLLLVPILSRIFLPAEYGIIDILTVSYSVLLIFLRFNTLTGFQKFYYQKEQDDKRTLVSSALLGLLLISLCVSALGFFLSGTLSLLAFRESLYRSSIIILCFLLPVEQVLETLLLLLRLKRRALLFSFFNIMRLVMYVVFTYAMVVWLDFGVEGVFLAKLIASGILALVLLGMQRKEVKPVFDAKVFKNLFVYSLPGYPAVVIRSFMSFMPIYLLSYFSTLSAVGIFGMANRIGRLLGLYMTSFNSAWNPFAFSNVGKEDEKFLYEKVFKVYASTLLLLGMALTLFSREILKVLTPPEYHTAAVLVGGICIYNGLMGLRPILSTAMYSIDKVKVTSTIMFIKLVVFVAGAVLLVPRYHAKGLILAMVLSAVVFITCYLYALYRSFRFPIPLARFTVLFAVVFLGVTGFNRYGEISLSMLVMKSVFVMACVLLAYVGLFNRRERTAFRENLSLLTKRTFTGREREDVIPKEEAVESQRSDS